MYQNIYCCETMYTQSKTACRHHPTGCPDLIIKYQVVSPDCQREIEAGIIVGETFHKIRYCPWCGTDLDSLAGPTIGFHLRHPQKEKS